LKGNKRYIYSTQNSLWGESECIGFGTTDFYIKEIPKETSKKIIIENHYSKKVCNDAHTHIHLGVFYKEKLMGALQYGYAMNPRSHSNIVKDSEFNEYKELNRMWISDNCLKYAESRAISYSIKYIKKKYPTVKWIQTFADERCGGYGIVYQACSFSYYGEHDSIFYEFEGEIYHNNVVNNSKRKKKKVLEQRGLLDKGIKKTLRQFRYIKFLDKREKKKCLLKEQPYPKHYKELKN
jgi:hypothetical protein